ncbi:MAG: hypothetical protein EOP85_09755 [Verrucomicrobiaceae bacterium]|nr:MAG: hypothetical protein EOP85_09755 [Verrucomicrobiaceae bacterium]
MKFLTPTTLCILAVSSQAAPVEYVQEIRVTAPPEAVWDALTMPELVKKWHMAPLQKIELKKGGRIIYARDGKVLISGTITEIEPEVKLSHTFRFGAADHPDTGTDGDTVVTYTLRQDGKDTVLKLVHSGFTEKNQTYTNVTGGWPFILKKLKVALEPAPSP